MRLALLQPECEEGGLFGARLEMAHRFRQAFVVIHRAQLWFDLEVFLNRFEKVRRRGDVHDAVRREDEQAGIVVLRERHQHEVLGFVAGPMV